MLIKRESLTSQKLGFQQFCQIANIDLIKGKSAMFPLFHGVDMLPSASDDANFLEYSLRPPILMTQISHHLLFFLQLIWNCMIFKQVPQYLKRSQPTLVPPSKAFGSNCIPALILKNSEPIFHSN